MLQLFRLNPQSPMARMDVRLKLACGIAMSFLVILVDTLPALVLLAATGMLFFLLTYPHAGQWKMVGISAVALAWSLLVSQGLFYAQEPRHVVWTLIEPCAVFPDGLRLYMQGMLHGLAQSLRMLAVMLTGFSVCLSTAPQQFMQGLRALRMPFALSFMTVTAIRFIPVAAGQFMDVRRAMRLKGYRPWQRGVWHTVRSEISTLRPVLAGTIRRSQDLALALVTRGFSVDANTATPNPPLSARAYLVLAGLAGLVLGVLVCKGLFWLYQQEWMYVAALRPLYAFTRGYL